MPKFFANFKIKSRKELSQSEKDKFDKIAEEYDNHDDGYNAAENPMTYEKLTRYLSENDKKKESESESSQFNNYR